MSSTLSNLESIIFGMKTPLILPPSLPVPHLIPHLTLYHVICRKKIPLDSLHTSEGLNIIAGLLEHL